MFALGFYIIAIIFALFFSVHELILFRKTKQLFHKIYALFSVNTIMVLIPFVILKIGKWEPRSIQSLLCGLFAGIFLIRSIYFYAKARKLQKSEKLVN